MKLNQNLVLLLLIFPAFLFAQKKVTGTITDSNNVPLGGVTILIKNSSKGTTSDFDGNYSIVAKPTDQLSFSYMGFKTKTILVGEKEKINVILQEEASALEEIVIVGYQAQKKVNLSGAVDNLKASTIESRPISNLSQGLQGISPNLNIDFAGGAPGQKAKINIRGFTSINGGDPLILIDGIPSNLDELNRISPEDVEDISILKDASSAAIYGARAAFGVVLISTKSGKSEKLIVRYSTNTTMGKPTVIPNKITDPYIYLRVRETSTDNTPWDNQNYSDETYAWAKQRSDNPSGTVGVRDSKINPGAWEYMGNKDWTNYFLSGHSFSQNHNLSASGKAKNISYYLSGSYNKDKGFLKIKDDTFKRYGLRSKISVKINDWLTIGNNTYLSNTTAERPTHFSLWSIYNFHPTDWDKNPDNTWANTAVGKMGAQISDGGDLKEASTNIQTTFNWELKLIEDILKVNGDYTIERGNENRKSYKKKYMIGYGKNDIREEGENSVSMRTGKENYYVFNIYGTFSKSINNHDFSAILGYNQEQNKRHWSYIDRGGIISSSLPTIALATGDAQVDEYITSWAIRGAFFRLNYIYNQKYILELNGRYDGSSRFPKNKRFGFFPSASVAWNVHKEPFMESLSGVVSNLKLRASYGNLGNQSVGAYGYIPTMSATKGRYIIGDKLPQRVTPPSLVSPNYTWEKVESKNIGVDLGLLDNKFLLNFDAYRRDTKGMLILGKELPSVLGAREPKENAGDLKTLGWEFSLNYKDDFSLAGKPFKFNTKFIISDNKSYITRFDNPTKRLNQFYEGMQLGEIWGLQSDGLFKSENEIKQLDQSSIVPWGALPIVLGWPKFKDLDGNKKIEKGNTVENPKDLSIIGNRTPRYRYGVNASFDWNGFDGSIFLQGVGKRDYYPLDYLYWGFYQQPYAGGYKHLLDFYRGTSESAEDIKKHSASYIKAGLASANTDAFYPVLQSWLADRNVGERIDRAKGLAIPQTRYMLNGAYLRLKNITIGYSLPESITKKMKLSRFRIYVTGENLVEWSQLSKYFDPEAISDDVSKLNPAHLGSRGTASGFQYPFQRKVAVGLNVTF